MVHDTMQDLSQSLRNQGFIRTSSYLSFHQCGQGLNPFEIRVSFELEARLKSKYTAQSQSLRNQGFIRTKKEIQSQIEWVSLNPFEIRVSFEPSTGLKLKVVLKSQSLRNQGFIRTAPTVNGFSLLSSRGSVPILSVLS